MPSMAGTKVSICTTPQNTDLANAAAAAALTYVEVGGVGRVGAFGRSTNMINYNTLATSTIKKAKGVTDLGSPEIEVEYDAADAGQDALRVAGASQSNQYVVRIEGNDTPATGAAPKPTIRYLRGFIGGPTNSNGGVEDFNLQTFVVGVNQLLETEPTAS